MIQKKELTVDMTGGRRKGVSPAPAVAPAPAEPPSPAPAEKRLVGEWAFLKGHCPGAFAREKKAKKRPDFRGDRHKGPDIRVVRVHMRDKWRTDYVQAGDTLVSEAEYDAAVNDAYGLGVGDKDSLAAHAERAAEAAEQASAEAPPAPTVPEAAEQASAEAPPAPTVPEAAPTIDPPPDKAAAEQASKAEEN